VSAEDRLLITERYRTFIYLLLYVFCRYLKKYRFVFTLLVTISFCHPCQLNAGRCFLISAIPFPNKLTVTGNYPVLLEEMSYDKQWMFHSILWKTAGHFLYLLYISYIKSRAPNLNARFCLAVIDFTSGSRLCENSATGSGVFDRVYCFM
jgi:hypothetical protein